MNLESVSVTLLAQFPDGGLAALQKQEKMLERYGTFVFGGFAVLVGLGAIGLIVGVILAMVVSGKDPVKGILLSLFILFASLALSYVFLNEHLKDKRKKLQSEPRPSDQFPPPVTGKLLKTGEFEPVPSVVEDTTDLLKVEVPTRRL